MGDFAFTDPVFPDSVVIVGVEAAFAEGRQSRAMESSIYAGAGTPAHPGVFRIVVRSDKV